MINLIQVLQKVGLETIKRRPCGIRWRVFKAGLLLRLPADASARDAAIRRLRAADVRWKRILAASGAKPVEWNYKTECCGAGMTMANEDTVLELSHKILTNAAAHGANCLVVACPMCHVNLDMKQADIERRYGVRARHDRSITFPIWSAWPWGSTSRTLGIDRHSWSKQ